MAHSWHVWLDGNLLFTGNLMAAIAVMMSALAMGQVSVTEVPVRMVN
jgi:hypothetical protein